jgi:hypothetical protein
MFKWVAGLCAAIYLTLLIFGAPTDVVVPSATEVAVAERTEGAEPTDAEPVVVVSEQQAEPVPAPVVAEADAAAQPDVIAPLDLTPIVSVSLDQAEVAPAAAPARETVTLTVAQPALPEPVEEVTAAVEESPNPGPNLGIGEIWKVTGSRVNLRTAATTNSSVIGQTVRGDSAEVVELLGNGWAKVYILESGIEAYMSADFIAREG